MSNVLAIGAHPDDLELGCGGTLIKHTQRGDTVVALVVTDGESGPGDVAVRLDEQRHAAELMGVAHLYFGHLPDGRVSRYELEVVQLIEDTIRRHDIDMVYVHGASDTHQDHRAVAASTWGAARNARNVLCYDSPSSIAFDPSIYVDITDTLEKKISALECHSSQVAHSSMASSMLVRTQAGYRGHHARTHAAEAFMPHRMLLSL